MFKRGFRQSKGKSSLTFKRGSPGGSWGSFSPEAWDSRITVDVSYEVAGAKVVVKFGIDTRWQLVLPWEKAFWKSEIQSLEESITGDGTSNINIIKVLRNAELLNIAFVPIALGITLVICAVIWFFPFWGIGFGLHRLFNISENITIPLGFLAATVIAFKALEFYSKMRSKQKPW